MTTAAEFEGEFRVHWRKPIGRYAALIDPVTWRHGDVEVTIPAGFVSDGTSLPWFLWWFMPPWGHHSTPAAVLHDFVCEELQAGHPCKGIETRRACDREYLLALLSANEPAWRAILAWLGVRAYSIIVERQP